MRGYFLDFREKTTAPTARTPAALAPAALAQLALGWWERSLTSTGPETEDFVHVCGLLLERAQPAEGALLWPYDAPVPKFGLQPPWHSALAQGQAASVLVRAHLATGEERYEAAALGAVAPLLQAAGELVTATSAGPILEEAPSSPPSHILNGWISALWGVWDVAVGLRDSRAEQVFQRSLAALRHHLHAYDVGWWTRYSLYPHAVEDLAKPIYHRLHVDQVDVMHRLTGFDDLRETAVRWRSYDRPVARIGAVAQKAVFAAVESRRRAGRARLS